MAGTVAVPIETLRTVSGVLLGHLESTRGQSLALDNDYFWSIVPEQAGNVLGEPNEFTIGQVSECLAHLQAIADDPNSAVNYALVWLGQVLQAVGEHAGE